MNKHLARLVGKVRYGKKLDFEGCIGSLVLSACIAIVSIYLLVLGKDNIFSGTFIDYFLYLEIMIFSLNSLYLSFELGVKFKEKEISE